MDQYFKTYLKIRKKEFQHECKLLDWRVIKLVWKCRLVTSEVSQSASIEAHTLEKSSLIRHLLLRFSISACISEVREASFSDIVDKHCRAQSACTHRRSEAHIYCFVAFVVQCIPGLSEASPAG